MRRLRLQHANSLGGVRFIFDAWIDLWAFDRVLLQASPPKVTSGRQSHEPETCDVFVSSGLRMQGDTTTSGSDCFDCAAVYIETEASCFRGVHMAVSDVWARTAL